MHGEVEIRPGEALKQTIGEHDPRPGATFFRRLADHHQRAGPLRFLLDQRPRGANPAGHVHVVAAGVHHRDGVAGIIGGGDGAGVGLPGLLTHRQCVHVGAQQHRRPLAVLQHADQPMSAHAGGHFEAQPL